MKRGFRKKDLVGWAKSDTFAHKYKHTYPVQIINNMNKEELGQSLGYIRYKSTPILATLALKMLQALHLPLWRQKQRLCSIERIEVREKGIVLLKNGRLQQPEYSDIIPYSEIRKVWFEQFNTDNEAEGYTSARIDVIAQNLDVIFSLTIHNRPADDDDIRLMHTLWQSWRKATWRHYQVVAAVVEHEGRFLCMQKGETRYAYTSYHWEFPGGKVEQGETEQDAICRELREEMEYEVLPVRHLITVEHTYPDFSLSLSCWLCTAETTEFVRKEHADHRWLKPQEMKQLEWCAADAPVIETLNTYLRT